MPWTAAVPSPEAMQAQAAAQLQAGVDVMIEEQDAAYDAMVDATDRPEFERWRARFEALATARGARSWGSGARQEWDGGVVDVV